MPDDGGLFRDVKSTWDDFKWVVERIREIRSWIGLGTTTTNANPSEAEQTRRDILLIGPGGVGKSTLAKFLAEDRDLLAIWGQSYKESMNNETFKLADPNVEILVAPGQHHRRPTIWPQLEEDLAADKFRGVIFVGSYGYHSLPMESHRSHRLYEGDDAAFLGSYLRENRNDELAVLSRVVESLKRSQQASWLLVLVTKQDLWCDQHNDVELHYRSGKFAARIDEISHALGQRRFRAEPVFASLNILNFVTGNGECLQKNTAGYDARRQIRSLYQLVKTLDELRIWEGDAT